MLAYLVIILLPIGVLMSPELRTQPLALLMAALCVLGLAGLIYGRWREWQAQQGMMDNRRR